MTRTRPLTIFLGLLMLWQLLVWVTGTPDYILPGPAEVLATWVARIDVILPHAMITLLEMLLGLVCGVTLGIASALSLISFRFARPWLLPIMVVSQAIPVFAIGPMLVIWFGYGLASKVVMATLIIYFPVTATFYDGLRQTHSGWLDLARTMGASRGALLRQIRIPAALPALASGLRVAASVVPIGAVVGEWVGSSAGLGYLMLHANGRMQVSLSLAALFTLSLFAVALYFGIDALLRRAIAWQPDSQAFNDRT